MRPRSLPGLTIAAVIALLTLAMAFSGLRNPAEQDGLPVWFLPFGVLMVLFLPGYTITRALLPELDDAMRLLLSLGVSISLTVLGGLVLHFTPWGITTSSWAVWQSTFTLLGCLCAWACRRRPATGRPVPPRMSLPLVISLLTSLALTVTAVWLARESAFRAGTAFTQFWAVPSLADGQPALQIGIYNQEKETVAYQVYMESRGRILEQWSGIVLDSGQTWETVLILDSLPQSPLRILLFRADDPDRIYRMVRVVPATFDALMELQRKP